MVALSGFLLRCGTPSMFCVWLRGVWGSEVSCKALCVSDGSYSHLNEVTGLVKGILLPTAKEVDIMTHPAGPKHTQVTQTPTI